MAGAAGEPPHNREEWGDYRGNGARGDSCEERGRSDSTWHWNIALAAAIQRYTGLASSGHRERWSAGILWPRDAGCP